MALPRGPPAESANLPARRRLDFGRGRIGGRVVGEVRGEGEGARASGGIARSVHAAMRKSFESPGAQKNGARAGSSHLRAKGGVASPGAEHGGPAPQKHPGCVYTQSLEQGPCQIRTTNVKICK